MSRSSEYRHLDSGHSLKSGAVRNWAAPAYSKEEEMVRPVTSTTISSLGMTGFPHSM